MAINSLSTGFRPGVCTSSTRPTAPYIGQHIYETDTLLEYVWNGSIWVRLYTAATTTKGDIDTYSTAPARLAVGTNNQILTANSATATGLEWQNNTSGLVYITGATIGSAVSSVAVANAFSSTYDNYLIQVINTVVSANQPNLGIQLTGTTSGYYYAGFYQSFASATMTGDVTTTGTYFAIGACGNGTGGSGRATMDVVVKSPNVAQATFFSAQNASLVWNNYYNGHMNNTTQYTGFTILPSSGTLTGGTIAVYGYRKA